MVTVTPYASAIKATKKSLEDMKLKLAALNDRLDLECNFSRKMRAIRDASYEAAKATAEYETARGSKKAKAKNRMKKLNAELNKLSKPFEAEKHFDDIEVLEQNIRILQSELNTLNQLQKSSNQPWYRRQF
tara:strand:+ start:3913 stop:4305 length:393 start_codon:yes stop_codon:yes gene_type:complete